MTRARPISRRTLLRGAGVGLALPLLEGMLPRRARADERPAAAGVAEEGAPPRRLVFVFVYAGTRAVSGRRAIATVSRGQPSDGRITMRMPLMMTTSEPAVDGGRPEGDDRPDDGEDEAGCRDEIGGTGEELTLHGQLLSLRLREELNEEPPGYP